MARYSLVAFDLYGTILDLSGLPARLSGLLAGEATELLADWRRAQVELTWELNQRGEYEPFDRVTSRSLADLAPEIEPSLHARLVDQWLTLPAYPDAIAAVERLSAAGVRTAVLSNGTRPMIECALRAAGVPIDSVRSADQVRAYKTDPRVYGLLDELTPRDQTLYVSGNGWDIDGALRDGRSACWIDRGGAPPGLVPDLHVHSLSELAVAIAPPDWRTDGVKVVRGTELDENTPQTPGMSRAAAITTASAGARKLWAGTVTIDPNARTGAHHHGEVESVIFVVRGRARMRWGERLEMVAEAGPGDFIYVPPYVPHQEINAEPGQTLECVLVRSGQDPVVVTLDLPAEETGDGARWIDPIHRG